MNFKQAIKAFYWKPYEFVVYVIGVTPTEQEKVILESIPGAIKNKKAIAIKSGHGVGKTALLSWIILWWLTTRINSKVPCTAPTQHQLYDVLWIELNKWWKKSKAVEMFEWTKTHMYSKIDKNTFAVALTSSTPEGMQGMHAENLLFIMDEASGIPNDVMEVVEGALTNEGALCIMVGNPTQITGLFFDAFNTKRKFYECFTLNAEEAPAWLVSPAYYKNLEEKYGRDSDIYRVRVLGDFPKASPDTLISLDKIEKALLNKINENEEGQTIYIGVDVARFGDDETVIAVRRGRKLLSLREYRKQDTQVTAGRVSEWIIKYGRGQVIVNVDDTGIGGGVTDALRAEWKERNIIINAVNNGEKSTKPDYENLGTECWFVLAEKIVELDLINDAELVAQLSGRKYRIAKSGKKEIEPKADMKRRGIKSPDRADAVVLAYQDFIRPRIKSSFHIA